MRVQCTCLRCGSVFYRWPADVGPYCSIACRGFGRGFEQPLSDRFNAKVARGADCWEWVAARDRNGYGRFQAAISGRPRVYFSHHVAWELASGAPVPPGAIVCHACDTPACVRNDDEGIYIIRGIARPRYGHLWLGTHGDNVADKVAKRRQARGDHSGARLNPQSVPRGDRHFAAKLTEGAVRAIRDALGLGMLTQRQIAEMHGVDQSVISEIRTGKAWRHVL